MVSWAVKDFGGMIPRTESRFLPDTMAEESVNVDHSSGNLQGLPIPELVIDLSAHAGTQRAYRFPLAGQPDVWLPLPSPYSSACRSPLANDTDHRVYWTNPPGSSSPGVFWMTRAGINNTAPYNLGVVQPDPNNSTLSINITGGTNTLPLIERSYCWTYMDQYGQESAPNAPTTPEAGYSDSTWQITGLPTTAPSNPAGKNYPAITIINLYRTSTGTNTGAQFYLVAEFVLAINPPPTTYTDGVADTTAVNNNPLPSASWANPPDNLDGLTALPGGMLVGFTDNTVHFCEPDRPHTWPVAYDQSMQYQILGFGLWQQSLVVFTAGYPSTGSGNSPINMLFQQIHVPEPCLSRGSIITDLMGAYYASQNGLVMLNYFGMQNQTMKTIDRLEWLNRFKAGGIIACRHRSAYLALKTDGSGSGFLLDYTEPRMGVVDISVMQGATCIWNDEFSGDAYICANGIVYRWDSQNTNQLTYRWRSKQFYGPMPVSIGAIQINASPDIDTPPPVPNTQTLTNSDSTLVLPDGVNAVFNLYAGPDGSHLVMSVNLTETRMIFRAPSGFKAFDWQFEIIARVPIHSVEIASTMRELKNV